jgi:hypothetical protein
MDVRLDRSALAGGTGQRLAPWHFRDAASVFPTMRSSFAVLGAVALSGCALVAGGGITTRDGLARVG